MALMKTFALLCVVIRLNALNYGCYMDGCNPSRNFYLGGALVPINVNKSLSLDWIFSAENTTSKYDDISTTKETPNYLGCTVSSSSTYIYCLFNGYGLYTLNTNGNIMWTSSQDIGKDISNITSVPLLLPDNVTIINDGLTIVAYTNGVFNWDERTTEIPLKLSNYLGFVLPQYFIVKLGDDRYALYDYSLGLCWASIYLSKDNVTYAPYSVASSIDEYFYNIGIQINGDNNNCALFAMHVGSMGYRIQKRWSYKYNCNITSNDIGTTIIETLDPIALGYIIFYGYNTNDGVILQAILDDYDTINPNPIWNISVNTQCNIGYLIDPRDYQYGTKGLWICDYNSNTAFELNRINVTNGNTISTLNVNDMISKLNIFNDNITYINPTSRGVSGIGNTGNINILSACFDIYFDNNSSQNMLIIIDIDNEYIVSYYMFNINNKCVGQLSTTMNGKLIIPLNDETSVLALI